MQQSLRSMSLRARRPRLRSGAAALVSSVLLAWAAAPSAARAQQYLTEDEALALAFPEADSVDERRAIATAEQRAEIARRLGVERPDRIFRYHVGRKAGRLLGYAVIDDVIGKHQPITYMIVFAPDHRVRAIEVLAYRESYGWEIRRAGFLKQFHGRTTDEPLRFGAEIQNISGATISVRSMIRAVNEKRAYVAVLLPKESAPAPAPEDPKREPREGALDPEAPLHRYARSQLRMGTLLEIQVDAPDEDRARRALDAAFEEVGRIEALLSTWIPTSAVGRLNAAAPNVAVDVGAETAGLLARAIGFRRASGGAFDVAAGPLVDLWREAARRGAPPSTASIETARALAGSNAFAVAEDGTARLARAGARIDLGALGKGYALDRAAAVLRAAGVERALLNFGGQLLATAPPAGGVGWPVAVRDPSGGERPLATFDLERGAVATSADDERGLAIAGRRLSHIVDPRTGLPAARMRSVTVRCPSAEVADAWSTALYVMDAPEALAAAERAGLDVLVVDATGRTHANAADFAVADAARSE